MSISDYLYQEVFVVGTDNVTASSGELTVCKSFEDLINHLSSKSIGINSDLRAVHGVLTSAKTIPGDLGGKQPFILIADPSLDDFGILIDSDSDNSCEDLAKEIERILASEDLAVDFATIDDVFILYGYEMPIILSVDEDDLDEGMISACASVALRAKELDKSRED